MAYHFNRSSSGPRASVVRYGSRAYTVAQFTDQNWNDKVDQSPAVGTPRRVDVPLKYAAQVFRRTGRKGSKIVILLAAGKQTKVLGIKKSQKAVEQLRILGARTYVITVGKEQSSSDLSNVVDEPRDILQVVDSSKLPSMGATVAQQIQGRVGK